MWALVLILCANFDEQSNVCVRVCAGVGGRGRGASNIFVVPLELANIYLTMDISEKKTHVLQAFQNIFK